MFTTPFCHRRSALSALLSSACLAVAWSAPAFAQAAPDPLDGDDAVIVTASPLRKSGNDVVQGVAALDGEALERTLSASLGQTIDRMPGISQSGYGQAASRPIIRGQDGDRIRILLGGIGSIDASAASPDHALAVDLGAAKRIEAVRGPATLLYGNNASGGVINILDGRIPVEAPQGRNGAGFVRLEGATNADERAATASVDAAIAGTPFVAHLDGFTRKTDDYKTAGPLESKALRALEGEDTASRGGETAANSDLEQKGAAFGFSRIGDFGFLGVSLSRLDSHYGLPGGHHEEGEDGAAAQEAEEEVRIDLEQTRFDLMGEINRSFAAFDRMKLRFGLADYHHKELEGDAIGTRFLNDGFEGRVELVHKPLTMLAGTISGASGGQFLRRDFEAIGEEAFVPPSRTDQYGLFSVQQMQVGPWTWEGGARAERQRIAAESNDFKRTRTAFSLSGSSQYEAGNGWSLGLALFRTERSPNAEELLSNGPHLATNSFEVGDRTLDMETSLGTEASLRFANERLHAGLQLFYSRYDDYVFERVTGMIVDGLPEVRFSAANARFFGFEGEADWVAFVQDRHSLSLDCGVDYVRADNLDNDAPLPRIPALSLRVGADYTHGPIGARLEAEWTAKQKRLAPFELPTDDYLIVNASVSWQPLDHDSLSILAQIRNLTDAQSRLASSFLKDRLPQPGRDFRLAIRTKY
jgi:iron complex outermembrane recepter protein